VEVLRAGFLPAGVEIALRAADGLPRVTAHEETLRRALMHLVTNALEAMDGPGLVEVGAGLAQGQVELSVRDTGHGMSQETMEQVFSPFFTGKGLGKGKGYGLGLALIRKAAEDWGGRVDVASREGVGTTVSLYLQPALAVSGDGRAP